MAMLYPIGIQEFEKIRRDGYVYVDKTDMVYRIASSGGYYFLSRPRRFGKSLLVSTLAAYFEGKRELFSGLAVANLEKEWHSYPVLRIDLSGATYSSKEIFDQKLSGILNEWEDRYGVRNSYTAASIRFEKLISGVSEKTGKPVVILIDEYDKPIIDTLDDESLQDYFRKELQGFYSVMKTRDACIRFGFMTGVTKIGKLNIFSGLNNIADISMDSSYADICGISEKDLEMYFMESVAGLAEANGLSVQECRDRLREMYDGYRFVEDSPGVYNPFSLFNAFSQKKFREYWFETGTPTFLVGVMRKTSFDVTTLADQEVDSTLLAATDAIYDNPVPLLFQSGYLTITGYNAEYGIYHLGFPNLEVKRGFLNYLMKYYTSLRSTSGSSVIFRLVAALKEGKPEDFMKILESLFADVPYQIRGASEKDFQYAMYIIVELLSIYVQAERQTSDGRIDLLLQTERYVYIFELKVGRSAEEALRQIEEKGYGKPFESDSRRLFKIGVNFSRKTRRIESWKIA